MSAPYRIRHPFQPLATLAFWWGILRMFVTGRA